MRSSTEVTAVLDEELSQFLVSIGEMERVRAGKARCIVCHDPVDVETIQLVVPVKNHVAYVCTKQTCLLGFAFRNSGNDAE